MDMFQLIAALVTVAAAFSFINHRWLRLPTTIGLMVLSLLASLVLVVVGHYVPSVRATAEALLSRIDFNETLMHGMLGFLLFAGALHVNLNDLAEQNSSLGVGCGGASRWHLPCRFRLNWPEAVPSIERCWLP
jgi:CPA1 family monovalent cation:H+ antiporter